MSNDTDTNEIRFQRGVAFLDALAPNWRELVDHTRFDFASLNNCVWGQLCSTGQPFAAITASWSNRGGCYDTYPVELGFEGASGEPGELDRNRDELSALWLAEITPEASERFTHIFQPYFMVETDADGSNATLLPVDWDSCYVNSVDGNADPLDDYGPMVANAVDAASRFMDLNVTWQVNSALDKLTDAK